MSTDTFDSSDSIRTAKPLRHLQHVTLPGPFRLEMGGHLDELTLAFETYGRLNERRDNAVLICHALSGDSHVARHDAEDDPGWWDVLVGPGKPVDTDRYFVVCPNFLGGCRGSTGPNSMNPATGRRYGTDFPVITIGDITEAQRRVLDHLGIDRLLAVIGGSLGGHVAMTLATRYPERVAGTVAVATSPRLTSQAMAFDVVGRNAILRDPAYHRGDYYDRGQGPLVGLAIARMLGHITYLSREAMTRKFEADRLKPRRVQTQFETKFAVGSYLAYQGDRFGERFDANSYLTLSMAIDLFDLGDSRDKIAEALGASRCRWLVLSFSSDWLFPPFQSREIVDGLIAAGRPVSYCNVQSDCGHDAFLLPNEIGVYGGLIQAFLANLDGSSKETNAVGSPSPRRPAESKPLVRASFDSPNIFGHHRLDDDTILEWIPSGASVLDLGCGEGELLKRLQQRGHRHIMGIEWDERAIVACVQQGLDVVQADLNKGLAFFSESQFDVVVLSQTLQTIMDVPQVLREVLRVGRRGIVSFPNAAYRKHRIELAEGGRAPRIHAEHGFHWYNTPYVRLLAIADFEEFCRQHGFVIQQQVAIDTESGRKVDEDPNLNANIAVVLLGN